MLGISDAITGTRLNDIVSEVEVTKYQQAFLSRQLSRSLSRCLLLVVPPPTVLSSNAFSHLKSHVLLGICSVLSVHLTSSSHRHHRAVSEIQWEKKVSMPACFSGYCSEIIHFQDLPQLTCSILKKNYFLCLLNYHAVSTKLN